MLLKLLSVFILLISPVYADTTVDGYTVDQVQTLDVVGDCPLDTSSIGTARICFDQTLGKLQCSEDGGAYADCVGGGGGGGSGTVSSGTANFLAKYPSTGTTVDDSAVIMDNGTNVGIGTINPTAKLHVTQASAVDAFRVDDQASDTTPFVITSAGSVGIGTAVPAQNLTIDSGTAGNLPIIQLSALNIGSRIGRASASYFGSAVNDMGMTSGVGKLWLGSTTTPTVIDANGNVGIGTHILNGMFEAVKVSTRPLFKLSSAAGAAGDYMMVDSSGNVGIGTNTPQGGLVVTNGNVGIGSAIPVNKLNVVTAGGTSGLANTESTANLFVDNGVVGTALGLNDSNIPTIQGIVNSTNAARSILLNPYGGNVGIGTSQLPTGILQVKSADNAGIILVSGTTNGIRIGTSATDTNVTGVDNTGFATYQPLAVGGSKLAFTISGVEKMSVATTGNVGVGTVNPIAPLEVNGLVVVDKVTADPCTAGAPAGGIFYNSTSNYMCYCNGTNDVKMSDDTTACF